MLHILLQSHSVTKTFVILTTRFLFLFLQVRIHFVRFDSGELARNGHETTAWRDFHPHQHEHEISRPQRPRPSVRGRDSEAVLRERHPTVPTTTGDNSCFHVRIDRVGRETVAVVRRVPRLKLRFSTPSRR